MKKFVTIAHLSLLLGGFSQIVVAQSGLSISPGTLPGGTAGIAYSQTLTPSGGSGAGYQFSITSGVSSLNALGLSFSAPSGVISGTPNPGTVNFTVQLTDSANDSTTQAYTLSVNATTVIHTFPGQTEADSNSPDGIEPNSLIQALDGNFYGTTALGGNAGSCTDSNNNPTGCGTVFRLNSDGTDTIIYSFSGGTDGGNPTSLLQGPDGFLYGTTALGGSSLSANGACTDSNFNDPTPPAGPEPCCVDGTGTNNIGCGTLFKIAPAQPPSPGQIDTLVNFDGPTEGAFPIISTLGLASDGKTSVFYGIAQPCSYCFSNGNIFSFVPSTEAFNSFPLGGSQLSYPNSLLQGECDGGENCDYNLYGTAQLGPEFPTPACPSNSIDGSLGCGGVFEFNLQQQSDTLLCPLGSGNSNNQSGDDLIRSRAYSPHFEIKSETTVIRQSGVRFPFGLEWPFISVPISLTESSDGSILGTTPWACFTGSNGYIMGLECGTDTNDAATVFQCQPVPDGISPWTPNTVYQFTDDSVQYGNIDGAADGGGSLTGLMLATDGNYYGSSGSGIYGIAGPEMTSFLTSTPTSPPTSLTSLNPIALLQSNENPDWTMQGSNGNFYGISSTGGASSDGSVFEVSPATPLPAPVQLSFAPAQIVLGNPATLTWKVPNAFSLSSQQCFPYVPGNVSGAGTWSATGTGSVSGGAFSDSASITPTESGTYNYAVTCGGITSGFITLQVTAPKTSQTITFGNPGAQTYGTTLTLSASASSGLPITYSSITGSKCTVSGNVASFVGTGTCTIYAEQAGNSKYSAAPEVPQSFTVNKAPQTITFANPGAQAFGSSLTLSATASSGLAVSYSSITTYKCTITGTKANFVAIGGCTIYAEQAGNSNYFAASEVPQSFPIENAQTITFANPGAQTYGTKLTLAATASSGLAVTYSSVTSSRCTVSGATATFVATGTCTVYAEQSGNSSYLSAPEVPQSFTINKAAQTITFANPGTQGIGTPLTLSATASSGLAVTYSSITGSRCTVSGNTAMFLAAGTCTIYAEQSGNSNYSAAAEVPQSFSVEKAQTITFANPGAQTYGTPLTLSATASSGLAVSYSSSTSGQCTVSGSVVTFVASGTCTINAMQAGNSTWAPAPTVSQSFAVNKASQTITYANPGTQTVGTPLTLTATASSGLTVVYSSITQSRCTVAGNTATFVQAGTCVIYAEQFGNADYSAAPEVPQSFTVAAR